MISMFSIEKDVIPNLKAAIRSEIECLGKEIIDKALDDIERKAKSRLAEIMAKIQIGSFLKPQLDRAFGEREYVLRVELVLDERTPS